MWHRNHKILMIGSIVAGLILAACGGGTTAPPSGGATTAPAAGEATTAPAAEGGGVTIRYGLWDSAQQPSYQAGADPASLKDLTWNPQDGGTFGQLIAKLTLDSNGKNGLDPAFDKTKVVQYGFIPQGPGGFSGQTQWSWLAVSNGFKFTDGPWTSKYYYDDPK